MPFQGDQPIGEIRMPAPAGFAPAPGLRWSETVDLAALNSQALIDLWLSKRPNDEALPACEQFDDLELRRWSDNLIMLDVAPDAADDRRYRYREIGSAAAAPEGGDFSGQFMHAALPAAKAVPRLQIYDRAIRTRAPVVVAARTELAGSVGAKWHVSALPLSHHGDDVDLIMVLLYVEPLSP
ncbi:MAG: hypothetical protein NXI18_07805 [Alphaproteobacteria bacterium]|nr:hypothetical protein [Alphaproteobacteria bacterium]